MKNLVLSSPGKAVNAGSNEIFTLEINRFLLTKECGTRPSKEN